MGAPRRRAYLGGLFAAAVAVLMSMTGITPAGAATADHYRIEMTAWIPMAEVTGPPPNNVCVSTVGGSATYFGDDHVGYDGSNRVKVAYEFTYDGSTWADIAVDTSYGQTHATDGLCDYSGQATSAGGVRATANGVQLYMDSNNPLVAGSPEINAKLDVSFRSRDELVVTHRVDKFPSHGIRVWKNGKLIATAVDYDVSCVNTRGTLGQLNVLRGLRGKASPITHDIDLRVGGQTYFGTCGKSRPPALRFPA